MWCHNMWKSNKFFILIYILNFIFSLFIPNYISWWINFNFNLHHLMTSSWNLFPVFLCLLRKWKINWIFEFLFVTRRNEALSIVPQTSVCLHSDFNITCKIGCSASVLTVQRLQMEKSKSNANILACSCSCKREWWFNTGNVRDIPKETAATINYFK